MIPVYFTDFVSPLTPSERVQRSVAVKPPCLKKSFDGIYSLQTGRSATLLAFQKELAPIQVVEKEIPIPKPRPKLKLQLDFVKGGLSPPPEDSLD